MKASEIAIYGMITILAIVLVKDHLIPSLIDWWIV